MIIQMSSGMGPIECRAAVCGIYRELKKEYPDIELIKAVSGEIIGKTYSSVVFSCEQDLSHLEGTIEWICKSPYRRGHKRKNWFIDVSIIPEVETIDLDLDQVEITSMRSGGHGGQNVNKVETGIRVHHIPTGIYIVSTRERSQYLNKQDALRKLATVLHQLNNDNKAGNKKEAWSKHAAIERGNPVRVYEGKDFKLKENKDENANQLQEASS